MRRTRFAPNVLLLAAGLLLAACSAVTRDNYEKIETGMSREEVYAILGKPDGVDAGGIGSLELSREVWNGRETGIRIMFAGDKVTWKSIDSVSASEH